MAPGISKDGDASWFPAAEIHDIRLSTRSRVVVHSGGLGWRDAHASITSGRVWSGRVPPVAHASFVYCMRGSNHVTRSIEGEDGRQVVNFKARQFGIMPSHAAGIYDVKGGADVLMVYLRGSMVRGAAADILGVDDGPVHLQPKMGFLDPLLEQICLEIVAALNRQDPIRDPRYVDQLAYMAAAHCLRNHLHESSDAEPPAPIVVPSLSGTVHRVCQFIDARLDGDLSLDTLAREAGLSPPLLTQAFAQIHGVTPHQYVIGRRVEHARRLLIGADLPLAEIALQTGFASQSHFSAVFKRVTSETPNAFRRGR
jgi:AraC family transcriptional regulator